MTLLISYHTIRLFLRAGMLNFPVNLRVQIPGRWRRVARPQPNSLSNIAGAIVQQQLRNFFSCVNYPLWHYSNFLHAQMVLKNDYNVPPKISYFHLPPLDHRLCGCAAGVNNVIRSPYERRIPPRLPWNATPLPPPPLWA